MKSWQKVFTFLLVICMVVGMAPITANADGMSLVFHKYFGGTMDDHFYAVDATSDGIVVAGAGISKDGDLANAPQSEVYTGIVAKYDNAGNLLWKSFNKDTEYKDILADNGKAIAVGGKGAYAYEQKAYIAKYDSSGNLLKEASLNELSSNFEGITKLGNNYIVTGNSYDFDADVGVSHLVCFSSELDIVWHRTYPTDSLGTLYGICASADRGLYAVGYYDGGMVIKFDGNGNFLWEKKNYFEHIKSIVSVSDGVIISGQNLDAGGIEDLACLAKYDSNGNYIGFSDVSYSSAGDIVGAITIYNNNIIVCGSTLNESAVYVNICNLNGDIKNKNKIDVSKSFDYFIEDVCISSDGAIIVTGYAAEGEAYSSDGFLMKLSGDLGTSDPITDPSAKNNGWKQENGKWYYYSNGTKQTGWLRDGNKWYYLGNDGAMKTGWLSQGGWYYLKSSGAMATGWQKIGSSWYYFSGSGKMATGWIKNGSSWYYLNGNGAMATGWQRISGSWYYLKSNGVMAIGWQKIGNTWYWFDSSGKMVTGSRTINGKTYRFSSSGAWIS